MNKTSIFIIPRASTAWRGNEAGWITASGWASAGKQLWGDSIVGTTDGVFSPQESMLFPRGTSTSTTTSNRTKSLRKLVPEFIITGYKDWRLYHTKPVIWPIENELIWKNKEVTMIWERHDLFPGPGRRLANKLKVPFVISVEAPAVWEAKKWGVNRPLWGNWLERRVEASSLKNCDLVSCVSEEVQHKVIEMGVARDKVIVSHNRVDSSVFFPGIDGKQIEKQYNLATRKVIGWTGSFRGFHGLDNVINAFKKVNEKHPDTILMLVGDGLEFETTKNLIHKLGLNDHVILTGRKPFTSIPVFVVNFNIALVSASTSDGFHYSPLKLREYLAAGKAVIAPRAGNLPQLFEDGKELVLYTPGDSDDLARKINELLENSHLHATLEYNAKLLFEREGTWVHELKKVSDILNIGY